MHLRKNIIIFGASGDIGLELVSELLSDNKYTLHLFANNNYSLIQDKYTNNSNVFCYKLDLSDREHRYEELRNIFLSLKNIYAMIYLSAISQYKLIQSFTAEEELNLFEINYFAYTDICRLLIPYMLQNDSSRIIALSSIWGIRGAAMEASYSASKAALIAFNQALSQELGMSNITVNTIASGWVNTKMNKRFSKDEIESFSNQISLGRIGTKSEIVKPIKFLLSEDSSYITGETLKIDGGYL